MSNRYDEPDNTKTLKPLTTWDFPHTEMVPEGYDMTSVPKLTQENFNLLIERHNEMVEVVNAILATKVVVKV